MSASGRYMVLNLRSSSDGSSLVQKKTKGSVHGSSQAVGSSLVGIFILLLIDFFFPHQMHSEEGTSDMYILYPRKGETWALFKARDILWSPQSHSEHKYDVVEILSDYVKNAGVKVGYLDEVTGFAGVFQGTKLSVAGSFFIKPNELYKFSHRILSFKMIATEGTGVPARLFELDTASLPLDPNDIWHPGKIEEKSGLAKSQPVENVLSAVTPGTRDKSRTSEHATTSLTSGTGSSKGIR
ncbi:hypothetical protein RDI58_002659 [Solanum bulbocastanum]|uniref:DUF3444 domain-containing protein n=1 Tax=Solanum bulbocastanum TaxID=147425 RepID=A0AAN8UDW2_SOLBU